jgi:membrane protein implicated in regulation of membrane protease activity
MQRIWYVLLLVPFVALLWLPFYAKQTPELWGIPFFYWYQFLWVPVTALLTLLVYATTKPADTEREQ